MFFIKTAKIKGVFDPGEASPQRVAARPSLSAEIYTQGLCAGAQGAQGGGGSLETAKQRHEKTKYANAA